MSSHRFFTLEEATALLPRVRALVDLQLHRRSILEEFLGRLAQRTGAPPEAVVELPDDPDDVRALKREIVQKIEEYQRGWNELEDLGALVKDPRSGLVDFYSRIEGRTVFLCWRHGEDSISHYHDVDAGFAGRKPLAAVRARQYN
jgi:hypothetical protein